MYCGLFFSLSLLIKDIKKHGHIFWVSDWYVGDISYQILHDLDYFHLSLVPLLQNKGMFPDL